MIIAYSYKGNLYLNITNRCSNRCTFCMRNFSYIFVGYDLELKIEPSKEEILAQALKKYSGEKEIVFCGIGEPLTRLNDVLWICKKLKEKIQIFIRVNTNGHVTLRYPNRDVAKELSNVIDSISISLNAENEKKYNRLCRPAYSNAYKKMLEFAKDCQKYFPISLSVLDLPEVDIKKCQKIATDMNAQFIIRRFEPIFKSK